jgi:myo-inositol 2-dehydrogenase/D-chiro-inositol 1-dehydrogenase
MARTIKLGIVGAGRIGRIHAENLALRVAGAEVIAVHDPDSARAADCAQRCRAEQVIDDARRLIESPQLEAVVICSPTAEHADQIECAAAAGKQIFCEKPIDLSLPHIDRALEAVARADVRLQVGFNRRFDPSFRRARALVTEGRIGTPELLRITSRDPEPPSAEYVQGSGGMFVDMTIHDFDLARWLVGSEIEEVYAICANLVSPTIGEAGDIDTAIVSLRYASGALGAIDNSRRASYGYDQRVEVFGSEGCVAVGNVAETPTVLGRANGMISDKPLHFFLERYQEAYREQMQQFVDALRNDTEVPVGGADGRISVLLAAAAERSRREHRPVALAELR